jgi:hypothetical protein
VALPRNEHTAAAWAFAVAVLWVGLAHDAFTVRSKERSPGHGQSDRGFLGGVELGAVVSLSPSPSIVASRG